MRSRYVTVPDRRVLWTAAIDEAQTIKHRAATRAILDMTSSTIPIVGRLASSGYLPDL
jgi:hypothetical protein